MLRLANILRVVSLLILLATLALWPTTHFAGHRAVGLSSAPGFGRFLVLGGGGVYLFTQRATLPADGSWTVDASKFGQISVRGGGTNSDVVLVAPPATPPGAGSTLRSNSIELAMMTITGFAPPPGRLGFASSRSGSMRMMFLRPDGTASTCAATNETAGVPFWSILAASAVAPGLWTFAHARRRRARDRAARGQCSRCGYDLRATPNVCPECGTTAPEQRPPSRSALEK
jgi:hypothetical protein